MANNYGDSFAITNPMFLVTGILAIIGWFIAFVGACAAGFLGVGWWLIIFNLAFIVGVWVAVGTHRFNRHRNMILVFLTISIVYMTNLIQILLNSEDSNGNRAAAGGSIILIICEFLWIFLLASNEDSWLVNKASNMNHTGIGSKAVLQNHLGNLRGSNVHPDTSNEASLPTHTPPATSPKPNTKNNSTSPMAPTMSEKNEARISKALHNYTSSPEDPNELSFEKGESLEIIDRSGNWWRARKTDGIEGIVPSNYFIA